MGETDSARAARMLAKREEEQCCEPDYDYERGTYDHTKSCRERRAEL
jgi:hypothetical protein